MEITVSEHILVDAIRSSRTALIDKYGDVDAAAEVVTELFTALSRVIDGHDSAVAMQAIFCVAMQVAEKGLELDADDLEKML